MTTSRGGQTLRGSLRWKYSKKFRREVWHARFTLPNNGKRTKYTEIDASIEHGECCDLKAADPCEHVRQARAAARIAAERVRESGGIPADNSETLSQYAKRWLDDRDGRVHSIRDDRGRMRLHVLPTLGPLDARTFGRDDVERLRDDLDAKIVKGELAWKTAASVWTLVTSICGDMVDAKKRAFRVRQDNPARDVKPPERGARKQKQYLHPDEFLKFVSHEKVPLRWRRAVTLAIFSYTRDAELRVLDRERDVDLDHGIFDITQAFNRRKPGETKGTKTDTPRRFSIEPNLMPLLQAMYEETGKTGVLIRLPSERAMARNLRRWLWKAGVRRPALHERSKTSMHLTWHDLRASAATWMAVRGDDPLKIMQRCGHRSFNTTMLYVREAEAVRAGFGTPFPALPACLIDPGGSSVTVRDRDRTGSTIWPKNRPSERGGRDSNPLDKHAPNTGNEAGSVMPTTSLDDGTDGPLAGGSADLEGSRATDVPELSAADIEEEISRLRALLVAKHGPVLRLVKSAK